MTTENTATVVEGKPAEHLKPEDATKQDVEGSAKPVQEAVSKGEKAHEGEQRSGDKEVVAQEDSTPKAKDSNEKHEADAEKEGGECSDGKDEKVPEAEAEEAGAPKTDVSMVSGDKENAGQEADDKENERKRADAEDQTGEEEGSAVKKLKVDEPSDGQPAQQVQSAGGDA
ncbi:unnamed protein product, partial [Mesorhabditis belari]|uniref:Uncharacterized protein n=1 Tax=Mesorhabditis belari TaxID=2138241 RepID=A0AAF3J6J1_9BILA